MVKPFFDPRYQEGYQEGYQEVYHSIYQSRNYQGEKLVFDVENSIDRAICSKKE